MSMQGFPNRAVVDMLRRNYPSGCRVELISMNDPFAKLQPGDQGTVEFVDDIGTYG